MTTLAAVNDTLISQNQTLLGIAKNTDRTGDRLDRFLNEFKKDKLKDLEGEREKKRSAVGMIQSAAAETRKEQKRISDGLSGFFNKLGLGGGLGAGAALGFLTAAGARLVTRGIPGLLAIGFSDEIADYLLGPNGEGDVKKAIQGSITGGAIGALFGLRAGIIGALLGGLVSNDEVKTQLTELETNVTDLLKGLGINIDGSIAKTGLMFVTETVKDGLKGVNSMLKGDFSEASENIGSTLTLLASLGFLLAPRAGVALAFAPLAALAKSSKGRAVIAMATAAMTAAGLRSFDDQNIATGGDENENRNYPNGNTSNVEKEILGLNSDEQLAVAGVTGVAGDFALQKALKNSNNKPGIITKKQLMETVNKNKYLLTTYADGTKTSTFVPKNAKLEDYLGDMKLNQKYPRLFKALNYFGKSNPITMFLLSSVGVVQILYNDNLGEKQKAALIGGEIMGMMSGAALGTAVGAILGFFSFGPIGAGVGVIGFGIAGYVLGNKAGVLLMEFLLDTSVTLEQTERKLKSNLQTGEKNLPTPSGIIDAVALKDSNISNAILQGAIKNNMDPARLYALAQVESSFNPNAVGDSGQSVGLFQLKKVAVDDVNRIYGTNYKYSDRYNPKISADIAAKYYQAQKTQYGAGNEFNAARFYNQGPGGGQSKAAYMAGESYARKLEAATNYFDQKIDQSVQNSQPLIIPNNDAHNKNIYIRDGGTRPGG